MKQQILSKATVINTSVTMIPIIANGKKIRLSYFCI